MVSAVDLAKRAFVKLLLQSAVAYAITLSLTRDSSTAAVMAAFRKVTARLHPDKGGNLEQQQALNAARDKWESAAAEAPGRGKKRKATDAEQPASSLQLAQVLPIRVEKYLSKHFRIQSVAVLLTYQKFEDFGKWSKFTKFIKVHLKEWGVKLWCATMETNADGSYHLHLCAQFHNAMERNAETFSFEEMRPNASANDSLGEGWCGKKMQDSINRCMFYVWANKIGTARTDDGTLCVDGNCHPAWVEEGCNKYVVSGRWLDKLLRNYKRCGRKPWKITPQVGSFIIKRLLSLRRHSIVTSTTLQAEVAKAMNVKMTAAAVRKHLRSKGYTWLPRAQKRQYSREDMKKRLAFARRLSCLGERALADFVSMAIDGVVLTVAPTGPTDRKNYCLHGETHMWRKRCEANKPELAGDDPFADQIPLARAIPLWAGISQQGYCEIIFHKTKKVNTEEWVKEVLKKGKLMAAVRKLQPTRPSGARRILCDNESFLSAKRCALFYKSKGIVLLQIPPRSPDLNPIEMYWAWVRRQMRLKDLEDLRCRRPALGKTATKARVRALLRTKKAQQVAGRIFMTLKAKCKEVIQKKGAAIRS